MDDAHADFAPADTPSPARPRFVTLFPHLEPVNLHKDVGQLPLYCARALGWKSTLAFCQWNPPVVKDPAYEQTVDLVHLGSHPDRGVRFRWLLQYVFRHARNIDVLNLYQLGPESLAYATAYKSFNPRGVVFLKLDMDEPSAAQLLAGNRSLKRRMLDLCITNAPIDFYTIETHRALELVRPFFEEKGLPIHVVPNGFSAGHDGGRPWVAPAKENILLTVGRLGTPQKNTELFLDAVERIPREVIAPWRVVLIGDMFGNIRRSIDALLERRPDLRERFDVLGHVDDRAALYDIYRRSKVVCLTSRWESFGLVLLEAMYAGCHVVTTNVGAAADVTRDGSFGTLLEVPDADHVARRLAAVLRDHETDPSADVVAHHHVVSHYDWTAICSRFSEIVQQAREVRPRAWSASRAEPRGARRGARRART